MVQLSKFFLKIFINIPMQPIRDNIQYYKRHKKPIYIAIVPFLGFGCQVFSYIFQYRKKNIILNRKKAWILFVSHHRHRRRNISKRDTPHSNQSVLLLSYFSLYAIILSTNILLSLTVLHTGKNIFLKIKEVHHENNQGEKIGSRRRFCRLSA